MVKVDWTMVCRLSSSSETFGGRDLPDHLGDVTGNVSPVLLWLAAKPRWCIDALVLQIIIFMCQNWTSMAGHRLDEEFSCVMFWRQYLASVNNWTWQDCTTCQMRSLDWLSASNILSYIILYTDSRTAGDKCRKTKFIKCLILKLHYFNLLWSCTTCYTTGPWQVRNTSKWWSLSITKVYMMLYWKNHVGSLECFDTVGSVTGRASGVWKSLPKSSAKILFRGSWSIPD